MDWLIFGSINIIVLTIGFLIISRRLRRQYNAEQFLSQVQQEVNSIVTELNHTTERNIQLLEDRIAGVREILEELDRRILMADEEDKKRGRTDQTYNHLREQRRAIQRSMSETEATVGLRAPVERPIQPVVADAEPIVIAQSGAATATRPDEAASNPVSPVRASLQRASTRDNTRAQVVELHRAGLDPVLIAQRCGITPGEAELIISIHGAQS